MDEKSTERKEREKESKEGEMSVATLSDLYPSTCLTWEALTGV